MAARSLRLRVPRRVSWGTVGLYAFLIPIAILTVMPLAYMLTQALSPESAQNAWPVRFIPRDPTINNFQRLFSDPSFPMGWWALNSVFVATATTALVCFISSLSGYAYARLEFPGRNVIFLVLLSSLMIPSAITFIPNFLLMRNLRFLNSYHGLIWIHAAGIGGIFLMRQQFMSVPKELEEAAVMDGASRFRIYWQVALPLVTSAMVTLAIGTFLGNWNDLFWPLIIMSENTKYTLPVGLAVLGGGNYSQRGITLAAATVASAPLLVLYAVFQRRIIEGIATSGLAGR
jgi:multiple sugar transport system permease protein